MSSHPASSSVIPDVFTHSFPSNSCSGFDLKSSFVTNTSLIPARLTQSTFRPCDTRLGDPPVDCDSLASPSVMMLGMMEPDRRS